MKIVQFSDIHFGNEDKAAIVAAAAYVEETRPDLVIASGDLTAIGAKNEMRDAFTWLRALKAPVIATPGNHDTPYFSLLPRLFDPFGRFKRASGGVRTDAWVNEKFAIVPINTARGVQWRKNWALGACSRGQTRRATMALKQAPESALKIVVTHHPLIWKDQTPLLGDTRGGPRALRALIEAGAQIFLSGHLHVSDIREVEHEGMKAVAVSCGTLSIRHRGEPAGFIAIDVKPDGALEFDRLHVQNGSAQSIARLKIPRAIQPAPTEKAEAFA